MGSGSKWSKWKRFKGLPILATRNEANQGHNEATLATFRNHVRSGEPNKGVPNEATVASFHPPAPGVNETKLGQMSPLFEISLLRWSLTIVCSRSGRVTKMTETNRTPRPQPHRPSTSRMSGNERIFKSFTGGPRYPVASNRRRRSCLACRMSAHRSPTAASRSWTVSMLKSLA